MINIYVIQVLLILFFGLLFREDKKKFLVFTFIILFVVMALRNARIIGDDSSSSYFIEFSEIQTSQLFVWPNPGLPFVMKVIHSMNGDYQWLIIVTAIIVCFAYYRLLVKYSDNSFISVMWFLGMLFYVFLFSALKQAWAMAFLCFAFDAIFEKKPIRFLLFVGLANLFHFPAIVFLPAYWIAKLRINKSFPILMLSVFVTVFVFRTRILNIMLSAYSKGTLEYTYGSSFLGTKFILMSLILIYAFYRYFTLGGNNSVFGALLYFMGIAACIQTFCFYNNIFERLADYYYQFSILFMPLILKKNSIESNLTDNVVQSTFSDISDSGATIAKKKIRNYTIEDIDINTVLSAIITIFCVWRYLSYVLNDAYFSPFYFFWQYA